MDSLKQPFIPPNLSRGPDLPKWKFNSDGKFTIALVKKAMINVEQRDETSISTGINISDYLTQLNPYNMG